MPSNHKQIGNEKNMMIVYIMLFFLVCGAIYYIQKALSGDSSNNDNYSVVNPNGTAENEVRKALGEDVNIQSFIVNGMKFKFYCTPKDGKVRFRYGGYSDNFLDSSDTELEEIISDYIGLPKGDHIRIGGGTMSAIMHIGHAGKGHAMSFNGVKIYIAGDEDNLEMVKQSTDADFIYVPCVRNGQD